MEGYVHRISHFKQILTIIRENWMRAVSGSGFRFIAGLYPYDNGYVAAVFYENVYIIRAPSGLVKGKDGVACGLVMLFLHVYIQQND